MNLSIFTNKENNLNDRAIEILQYIKILRKSFNDASTIYKWGACYGFYQIMKYTYKDSEAYMENGNHVLVKIEDNYYDIDGIYIITDDIKENLKFMNNFDHYIAEAWLDGQRVERMIKKYSDINL